jgi:hypothetical protein
MPKISKKERKIKPRFFLSIYDNRIVIEGSEKVIDLHLDCNFSEMYPIESTPVRKNYFKKIGTIEAVKMIEESKIKTNLILLPRQLTINFKDKAIGIKKLLRKRRWMNFQQTKINKKEMNNGYPRP